MNVLPVGGAKQSFVGYNTIGASKVSLGASSGIAKQIVLTGAGILVSVGAYIDLNSNLEWAVGVATDNAGANGIVVGAGEGNTGNGLGTARWVHVPIGVFLAAGTYWLHWVVTTGGANPSLYYDTGGSDQTYVGTAPFDGALTAGVRNHSIRASFLPA